MKAIWKRPGCPAQEIVEALSSSTDWGPATIKTLLNRLLRKKALRFERSGKAYLYFPAFPEEAFKAAEADSFVARIFDGNLSPMLAHFAKSRRLSKNDLNELQSILRKGGK